MLLVEILTPSSVIVPLKAVDKKDAICQMVNVLKENGSISNAPTVLKIILEREAIRSTGIGDGFAIPHGKCNATENIVMAVAKLETPIDFDSIDGKPVTMLVLLVSPLNQTSAHIQALARMSRLMTNKETHQKIWDSNDPKDLFDLITITDSEENASQ